MKCWVGIIVIFFLAVGHTAFGAENAPTGPLFRAIQNGDADTVKTLLEAGASPDAKNADGVNALYFACDKEQPGIAKLLVERGADVNLTPTHGSTALQVSIYRGFDSYKLKPKACYPELIQLLLAKGADVNATDVDGNTPLIAAAEKDDVTTMNLLLTKGADLAHTNENGWTALERAVQYRRRTIARLLVAAGAPLDGRQKKYLENYHFARKNGNLFPLLFLGSFIFAGYMHKRSKDLPKRSAAPRMGDDLPQLQPLKCNTCGGSASLRPGEATCSHCYEPVPVPQDYTDILKLREQTFSLMSRAVKLWKRVRIVSSWPMRLLLLATAIYLVWRAGSGIFPHFIRDAFYNLMTFTGTMVWCLDVLAMSALGIALIGYAIYLWEVRSRIPAPPLKSPDLGKAETLHCPNCAGTVELKPGDLVGICGYCGGETYRVALTRQSKGIATTEKDDATLSLYEAMRNVYALRENAALAIPAAIIVIGIGLAIALRIAVAFV